MGDGRNFFSRFARTAAAFLRSRRDAFTGLFRRADGEADALNGLRAFSILAVFLLHVYVPAAPVLHVFPAQLDLVARNLTSGVDLFFVLSGFLVYGRLMGRLEARPDRKVFLDYFRARIFRIVPAYYVALLGSLVFLWHLRTGLVGSTAPEAAIFLERVNHSLDRWWTDFLFVSNYSFDRLLEPGWSLGVEAHYYLILPPVALLLFRLSRKGRMLLLGSLYFVPLLFRIYHSLFAPTVMVYFYTHTRIDSIIAGMIASEIGSMKSAERLRSGLIRWSLALGSVLLIGSGHLAQIEGAFYRTFRYSCFSAGFGLLLLLALSEKTILARVLSNAPLRYLARISYAMYLWHPVLAMVAVRNNPFQHPLHAFLWNLSVGLTLTVAGATLATLFVEEPFLKIRHDRHLR